jgi:hypothetical protein
MLPWLPWNINNINPQFSKDHLASMNLSNFKIIEAMGLQIIHRGHLEWHSLCTKFHENLPSGPKVIGGGGTQADRRHTDRQTDW